MGVRVVWASCSFSRIKDTDLVAFSNGVHSSMTTAVAIYPSPSPSLATLQAAITAFNNALIAAADGGKALTAFKRLKRQELQEVLLQLTIYVNSLQYGNEVNLLLSGFSITKREPGPIGPLPAPSIKKAWSPGAGQLYVLVTAFKYQPVYRYEYRIYGTTEWSVYESRSSHVLITGLASVNLFELRVCGVNVSQVRNYSSITQVVVV